MTSDLEKKNCENTMMCHLDKTSCSRYNTAAYFGVDAESVAAVRNAFWGGRGVRGGGGGSSE